MSNTRRPIDVDLKLVGVDGKLYVNLDGLVATFQQIVDTTDPKTVCAHYMAKGFLNGLLEMEKRVDNGAAEGGFLVGPSGVKVDGVGNDDSH